jgi:hypothetical protein
MINLPIKQDVLMHFIINNVLMLIAVIAVALRLTARRLKRNPLGADDYFIIAAVVCARESIFPVLTRYTADLPNPLAIRRRHAHYAGTLYEIQSPFYTIHILRLVRLSSNRR